jgi:hypothetical protein
MRGKPIVLPDIARSFGKQASMAAVEMESCINDRNGRSHKPGGRRMNQTLDWMRIHLFFLTNSPKDSLAKNQVKLKADSKLGR